MKVKEEVKKAIRNSKKSNSLDDMLNDLIYLGMAKKNIDISGFSFEIKTLTEEENREIVERLLRIDEDRRLVCVKAMTLSKAITKINDYSFKELASAHITDDSKKKDEIELEIAKNEIILKLQSSVTDRLFTEYEALLKSSRESINVEKIKN